MTRSFERAIFPSPTPLSLIEPRCSVALLLAAGCLDLASFSWSAGQRDSVRNNRLQSHFNGIGLNNRDPCPVACETGWHAPSRKAESKAFILKRSAMPKRRLT
jgi:hypothetical protein